MIQTRLLHITAQQERIDSESTASDMSKAEEVDGCGSSIGVAVSAMVVTVGAVAVFKCKKQDRQSNGY